MNATTTPIVCIVDDDEQVRESLEALVHSMNLAARSYSSGREFLDTFSPDEAGCVVLDLKMPQVTGLEVLDELAARGVNKPVIMISGHGDIPAAVKALKSGAIDFLEKPYRGAALMDSLRKAIEQDQQHRETDTQRADLLARYETLSDVEKNVLRLTTEGKPDKAIALKLDLSLRTIQLRRARVMDKMQAANRAELIRLAQQLEQTITL